VLGGEIEEREELLAILDDLGHHLREFARYGELLKLELGVEPTERLRALAAALGAITPR